MEPLRKLIETNRFPPNEIRAKAAVIYREALVRSRYLDAGNFTRIHPSDLQLLFELYDREFFAECFRAAVGGSELRFRISRRMTVAGGHTVRYVSHLRHAVPRYEIAVSSTLLFQAFADESQRTVSACGWPCRDRLEVLQRIFEHELVHLLENVAWGSSSCSAQRFQSIAWRFFGHTEHTHRLVTPQERAFVKFRVRRGSRVRFRIDGRELEGIVNRVTKRATVLVRDERGTPYSDGWRYAKYYVPVSQLEVV